MPKTLRTDADPLPELARILNDGGVIVFPTETVYGLGVDATNAIAMRKIHAIKGRDAGKPLSVAVPDITSAKKYGLFSEIAERLAHAFLPGPLTLIVPRAGGAGTIGIRIPDHPWLRSLLVAFDKPATATSANRSGAPPCRSIAAVRESLGASWHDIDAVVDAGTLPSAPPSTIVDCTGTSPRVLREGLISGEDIAKVVG